MGSFWAHLQAGTFFIILSFWWMYHSFLEHIKCVSHGKVFESKIYYETRCCTRKSKIPPLEIILRFTLALIGFLGEFFDQGFGFHDENGEFRKTLNMTHCTIYGMFVLQAVLDMLNWYRFPLPKNLNYLFFAIGFLWFGIAFYLHELHAEDKMPLEKLCHQLQIISLIPTGIVFLFEMHFRKGLICMFIRTLGVMTLGTFFIQMAFILFIHDGRFPGAEPAPDWNQKDMRNIHYTMAAYGAHIGLNMMVMVVVYLFIAFLYRWNNGLSFRLDEYSEYSEYAEFHYRKLEKGKTGDDMKMALLNDDDL